MELLEELEPKIKRIASMITNNRENQKDLAQEMRLHIFEKRESLKDKKEAYILRSCYFYAKHYINQGKSIDSKWRKSIRVVSLYYKDENGNKKTLPLCSDLPSPMDVVATNMTIEKIRSSLPKRQKQIFELLLEGYIPAEIAKTLKVTRAAVSKNMKKIREKVSKYLKG